jgi:hypothetical protein
LLRKILEWSLPIRVAKSLLCNAVHSLPFALLFLAISCDAPRTNPFDPANPDGTVYYLDGTILSDARTPLPLSGVSVSWNGTGVGIATDNAGKFSLSLAKPLDGWLHFDKQGYVVDSLAIEWNNQREIVVQKKLHALPVVDSVAVWSVVKNKYSGAEYGLEAHVHVVDEYDIDSIFIVNSELGIRKPLQKITSSSFHASYLDYELGLSSLNETIGRILWIVVLEQGNASYTVGSTMITRIIDQEIETISPKNQDTVLTAAPLLRWKRFTPGFTFSYKLEVYTNEPEPKLEWSKTSFSSDSISITVNPSLPVSESNNSFYWVIWCVDEFNNCSRSKPASFIWGSSAAGMKE